MLNDEVNFGVRNSKFSVRNSDSLFLTWMTLRLRLIIPVQVIAHLVVV